METEIWKEFDSGYKVSNYGRVMGKYGKILIPAISNSGYLFVGMFINRIRKNYYIHRLVALLFLENPDSNPNVNHKNGIKTDNRIENLEWCTQSYNMKHAFDTGLVENNHFRTNHPRTNKGKFGSAHHSSKLILQFTKDNIFIREWGSMIDIQSKLFISQSSTSQCCHGKQKTAGGFIFKFASK